MQNNGSVSPVRQFFRNKWVRLILVIDAIVIFTIIGVLIWNATKTATINFSVTPLDAKIQIDGHGEYYNGSYQVHPGEHTITIKHNGLATKTFNLDLESGYNTTLTAFLKGENNNFDFYKLKNNYESFQKLAEIASQDNNITTDHDTSAENFIQTTNQALGIMDKLPIIGRVSRAIPDGIKHIGKVTISEAFSDKKCKTFLCLDIDWVEDGATDNYPGLAFDAIIEAGYNPENYELILQGELSS